MVQSTSEAMKALLSEDDEVSIVRPEVGALEAITRSEVAMQLDSAHRYRRAIKRSIQEATTLATFSVEVAASCMYAVPRDGKTLTGPSVRLAEMFASAWGNLHVGARVIDVSEREITAQAVAWDLEKNLRVTVEVPRSITGKRGRFSETMIQTTGLAAISIAFRNSIFRVIPRAYVDSVYQLARDVAVGDAKTLVERRDNQLAWFLKRGIVAERVFARLDVTGLEDVTLEHLEILLGLGTAIKSGELPLDEAFPAVAPVPVPEGTPEGKRIKIGGGTKKPAPTAKAAPKREPEPEAKPEPPHKPANDADVPISGPKPAGVAGEVDLIELHETLAQADDRWAVRGTGPLLIEWTEEQRRAALTWAQTVVEDGPFVVQANRPPWTKLPRVPGEEG